MVGYHPSNSFDVLVVGAGAAALPFRAGAAPAYWNVGGPWGVLADGAATNGSCSLIEQLMPLGPQAPPHVHEGMDEVFHALDGEAEFLLENCTEVACKGALVFILPGTVHGFRVTNWTPPDVPAERRAALFADVGMRRVGDSAGSVRVLNVAFALRAATNGLSRRR